MRAPVLVGDRQRLRRRTATVAAIPGADEREGTQGHVNDVERGTLARAISYEFRATQPLWLQVFAWTVRCRSMAANILSADGVPAITPVPMT